MSMKTPAAGSFGEITKLIEAARQKAFQAVNTVLIDLYWHVGKGYAWGVDIPGVGCARKKCHGKRENVYFIS